MTCPTIPMEPEAAENALWACAGAAVDTAVFALVLCFGLLFAAQLLLLWLTLRQ